MDQLTIEGAPRSWEEGAVGFIQDLECCSHRTQGWGSSGLALDALKARPSAGGICGSCRRYVITHVTGPDGGASQPCPALQIFPCVQMPSK